MFGRNAERVSVMEQAVMLYTKTREAFTRRVTSDT